MFIKSAREKSQSDQTETTRTSLLRMYAAAGLPVAGFFFPKIKPVGTVSSPYQMMICTVLQHQLPGRKPQRSIPPGGLRAFRNTAPHCKDRQENKLDQFQRTEAIDAALERYFICEASSKGKIDDFIRRPDALNVPFVDHGAKICIAAVMLSSKFVTNRGGHYEEVSEWLVVAIKSGDRLDRSMVPQRLLRDNPEVLRDLLFQEEANREKARLIIRQAEAEQTKVAPVPLKTRERSAA